MGGHKALELELIKKTASIVLGVDGSEMDLDTTFEGDLGADSLDEYQILAMIEDELHISFEPEKLKNIKTVGQAVELIREKRES